MERKRTTIAVWAILAAALGGGCSDADREKIAEDRERATQAVEERAKADWAAAKETFDEQKAALWEASAPVREKAEEWGDAASAKAEEWGDAASAKAVEWSEKTANAVEDWAANGKETEPPRENE